MFRAVELLKLGTCRVPAHWLPYRVPSRKGARQTRQRLSSPGGHDFPADRPEVLTIAAIPGHGEG